MSNRNRVAGHNWERKLAQTFRELGYPNIVTSRKESRSRDDQKVDLINENEAKNGRFVFNVQAKNSTQSLCYPKLLAEQPQDDTIINVIIHKHTQKSASGSFMGTGNYAILKLADFFTLIELINKHNLLTPDVIKAHRNGKVL